jgi:hypothetical protein
MGMGEARDGDGRGSRWGRERLAMGTGEARDGDEGGSRIRTGQGIRSVAGAVLAPARRRMGNKTVAALVMVGSIAACNDRHAPEGPAHTCTFFEAEFQTWANSQVDLLFVVDNSPSMGDKAALLATALPDLLNHLVNPDCIDAQGNFVGVSSAGRCPLGRPLAATPRDLHVAIVSSSLGAAGGDLCGSDGIGARQNDRGELLNRVGEDEHSVGDAEPSHLLAWFPSAALALTLPAPPVPNVADSSRLVGDFADMTGGVHTSGCAFEAPMESLYRFLVQPDPYDHVDIAGGRASLVGVNATLLRQRRDFLRPGSLLDIVVVTDENDASLDPMALGGQAWQFASARFPGSPNGTAPRATTECANPSDPGCTSCALIPDDPSFALRCPGGAYLDPSQDPPALRFFHMKQRFGTDALFPVSRYVRGLMKAAVPDRYHEHDATGAYLDGDASANCVNPIFAQDLPTDPGADLCHLTRGPRTPDLVYYTVIGGVPHELLQAKAGVDVECQAGTAQADCPQKSVLSESDWKAITGKDAEHYDFEGMDPHMLESPDPRAGLPSPIATNDADPIVGREWTTHGAALELACTFPLPAPKLDCTPSELAPGCDCGSGGDMPVCDAQGRLQTRGKAYPSIREMEVAHAMANSPLGPQGAVSSICPIHAAESAQGDPAYGFRPVLANLAGRLVSDYGASCLPSVPARDASGRAPCIVLAMLPRPGNESVCTAFGLDVPDADVLGHFRGRREAEWRASGEADAGVPNPQRRPMCLIPQLAGSDLDLSGSCATSPKAGWCLESSSCPAELMFSPSVAPGGDLAGALITVACSQGC